MSSNYSTIIDEEELYEDYVIQIFTTLFSGPHSTSHSFFEITKSDWDTRKERKSGEIIQNATKKYNITLAAKEWTKTDPRYAKIHTLPTSLS